MKTTKEKALDILENDAMVLINQSTVDVPAKNGILDSRVFKTIKEKFLKSSIRHLDEDIIKYTKGYPEENFIKVNLETAIAVLKLEDYIKLKELLEDE